MAPYAALRSIAAIALAGPFHASVAVVLRATGNATQPFPKVKFVILSQERSGSSFVTTMLDSHPNIHCGEESLGAHWVDKEHPSFHVSEKCGEMKDLGGDASIPWKDRHRFIVDWPCMKSVLDTWYARDSKSELWPDWDWNEAEGFKIMVDQGLLDAQEQLAKYFRDRDIKVVTLWRKNTLRMELSNYAMQAEGGGDEVAHPESDVLAKQFVKAVKVDMEYGRLIHLLRLREEERRKVKAAYKWGAGKFMQVYYEDLVESNPDNKEHWEKLQNYLGVKPAQLRCPYKPLHAEAPLNKYIENYNEVAEGLKGTEFEDLLSQ